MPRKLELDALEAELKGLSEMFSQAEEIDDPVGVMQYRQRKEEVLAEMDALKNGDSHIASVALYFGGKPVFGSRGISAEFAGKALEKFQDIVSKQFARAELGKLGERGVVPLKDMATLMVTSVTHGSFGFVLDEMGDQGRLFDSTLKEMVAKVVRLIESTSSVSEADFETALEEIDSRSLIAFRGFFSDLDSNGATVRFVDDVRDVSLDDGAVHRARLRMEATQIDDDDILLDGILVGFLPQHRKFELSTRDVGLIWGSTTAEASEQFSEAVSKERSPIGKNCSAKAIRRTVKPTNRPPRVVYTLTEFASFD